MNTVTDHPTPVARTADLYRMVMDKHVCPYGLKSKWLLERNGYEVRDHPLTSREETDAFKAEHDVKTTPQTFIDGERIGGYDDLRAYFGETVPDAKTTSYQPVIAIFAVCALMAIGASWWALGTVFSVRTIEWFAAFSMSVLAIQKLQNVEKFSSMFLNYDLLARRWVPYAYRYPLGVAAAGVQMTAGATAAVIGAPIALTIGTIGAVSVFKAVY
ncbi:MAG: glutaredoxin domain-containing protein, partial [Woeseiaceae bacterium]|nr:glutaredoxin domain-containing protein [Woeseiaceae bacterium]